MIDISPADALELPIDELGLIVLEDLVTTRQDVELNYLLIYTEDQTRGWHQNPAAYISIAEAIAWLRANFMIAHTPGDNRSDSIKVTRWGYKALEMKIQGVRSVIRLQNNLHPAIERKARRQFLLGEYEMAIFASMKAVEVRVRKLAKLGDEIIGVDLMTQAFRKGGPLADTNASSGEVQGMMMLFAGTFAVLRNPSGHREVEYDDVTEASEAVITASMLMRILDRVAKGVNG